MTVEIIPAVDADFADEPDCGAVQVAEATITRAEATVIANHLVTAPDPSRLIDGFA